MALLLTFNPKRPRAAEKKPATPQLGIEVTAMAIALQQLFELSPRTARSVGDAIRYLVRDLTGD